MISLKNGVITTTDIDFNEKCGGFGVLLFQLCVENHNKVALINSRNDEFETYNTLLQKSLSTAKTLQNRGLNRNDLVAICSNKENINANVIIIATQFLGCISYSLDPRFSMEEFVELLEQAPPKILFYIEQAKPRLTKALNHLGLSEIVLVQLDQQFKEEFLQASSDNIKPVHVDDLVDTCMIHFSSGTTGTPKPICLNHYYFLSLQKSIAFSTKPLCGTTLNPVSLRYSNWYWMSASLEMVIFMLNGGCRVLKDTFKPEEFCCYIEKYHVSDVMLTPTQCIELLDYENTSIMSNLKKIVISGHVLHKDFVESLWKKFPGVSISQAYGLTECGEVTAFNLDLTHHKTLLSCRPQSCGLPVPGLTYKVVDLETGKNCGPNQPGELHLKGTKMFNGFYNKNCSNSFDNEGFFKTGDLVRYDDSFCFFILDRIKSILIWNNWFIYPHHIENVLLSHPAVHQALVIGIPHKTQGERLMGVVMLKEGVKHVTEQELEKFVEGRVEDHKRLREGVKCVKDMPTTVSGKVNRFKLKQMILTSLGIGQNVK